MSIAQTAAAIAVMAVVTFLTRALPFFLFDRGGKPPKVVLYLGKYLPAGVIAMLIVYCLKGVRFTSTDQWLPALLACAAVVGLHLWKRNNMLSIMGGDHFLYGAGTGHILICLCGTVKAVTGRACPSPICQAETSAPAGDAPLG